MRITSLKVFVDLAESGSFGVAAERNGISQPAVSQQIGGLEEEFGASLVERSRRRFRLTPAGEAVLATAHKVLNEVDALKSRVSDLNQVLRGELQVATTSGLGVEWLPKITAALHAQHPHITIEPIYRPSARIAIEVAGNVADFALVPCPEEDARFETLILAQEPFCFVASPALVHPGKSPLLARLSYVAYTPDAPTGHLVQRALQEHGYEREPVLQFEHPDMVLKAVHATQGFTCLPVVAVAEQLASGELVELFADRSKVVRQIGAIFLKQRMHLPMIRAVHDHLQTLVQSADGTDSAACKRFRPEAVLRAA